MFRYSYKVEAERLRTQIASLDLDILLSNNERARTVREEKLKQLAWYEERIANGQDPGYHNL